MGQKAGVSSRLDNYHHEPGRKFDELLGSALKLATVADDTVNLGEGPRNLRHVPPVKEDCRDVDIEEKAGLLLAIEKAADLPLVTSRRANYLERIENVRFIDSSGSEYLYEICRSGFSVMAVASRNGTVQMGTTGSYYPGIQSAAPGRDGNKSGTDGNCPS